MNTGEVDLKVLHGASDAPAVDVIARGVATLVDDAAYGDMTPYFAVPAGSYTLDITPAMDNNTVVASFTADLSGLAGGAAVAVDHVDEEVVAGHQIDADGYYLTMQLNFDKYTVKSITGYRTYDSVAGQDNDHSPSVLLQSEDVFTHEQLSQEFRLSGVALNDLVR